MLHPFCYKADRTGQTILFQKNQLALCKRQFITLVSASVQKNDRCKPPDHFGIWNSKRTYLCNIDDWTLQRLSCFNSDLKQKFGRKTGVEPAVTLSRSSHYLHCIIGPHTLSLIVYFDGLSGVNSF